MLLNDLLKFHVNCMNLHTQIHQADVPRVLDAYVTMFDSILRQNAHYKAVTKVLQNVAVLVMSLPLLHGQSGGVAR